MIQHTLYKANHILVVTHIDPDGDAIGSLTAMGTALEQLNLPFTLACDDNVPPRFMYLPLADRVVQRLDRYADYDLVIALDCGDDGRMGNTFANLPHPRPFVINIDHHVTNTRFGDINVVESAATSTAEVLHGLFPDLGVELNQDIAESLLTGLVTDTLAFRTVGVSAHTMRVAADLVEAGADLGAITMRALNLRAYSTLLLWRTGLNHMNLEDGLIWTTITHQERQSVDFRSNSSVGLVNLMADVEEAAMSAVLMDLGNGFVKVGFRCRPPYNVAEVALQLGGGGHPLAAGCTLNTSLDEAEATVVELCKQAIEQQAAVAQQ